MYRKRSDLAVWWWRFDDEGQPHTTFAKNRGSSKGGEGQITGPLWRPLVPLALPRWRYYNCTAPSQGSQGKAPWSWKLFSIRTSKGWAKQYSFGTKGIEKFTISLVLNSAFLVVSNTESDEDESRTELDQVVTEPVCTISLTAFITRHEDHWFLESVCLSVQVLHGSTPPIVNVSSTADCEDGGDNRRPISTPSSAGFLSRRTAAAAVLSVQVGRDEQTLDAASSLVDPQSAAARRRRCRRHRRQLTATTVKSATVTSTTQANSA